MLRTLVRRNISDAKQMLIKAKRKENTVSDPDTNIQTERRLRNTLNTSTHQLNKKSAEDPLQSFHLSVLSVKWGLRR